MPLYLSHVSSYWRDVAHHTPELWTSIRLRREVLPDSRMRRHQALIDMWLTHSANPHISVYLHYPMREELFGAEGTMKHFYFRGAMCSTIMSMLRFTSEPARIQNDEGTRGFDEARTIFSSLSIAGESRLPTRGEIVELFPKYRQKQHINLYQCTSLRDFKIGRAHV